MAKYRVIVDRNKCVDCGISIGRCPRHAQLLAQVLEPNSKQKPEEYPSMGVFSENINYIKELVKRCPEKALVIKKIEQK
jgi:ferredoxin